VIILRLDKALVELEIAESRNKAQFYISAGVITVNNSIIKKNSFEVTANDVIQLVENPCPFVSKGGLKLEKAITDFNICFNDRIVLDIGASTGGFTDCALQHGAKKVYAVDVGHGQLHESLTSNERVINLEGINIRTIDKKLINEKPDIIVIDVSFISLAHVFPVVISFIDNNTVVIALIKPQFEAGKKGTSKGVVKHAKDHIQILTNLIDCAANWGLSLVNLTYSPYKGEAGNIEFLSCFCKSPTKKIDIRTINNIVNKAHLCL